MPLRKPMDPNEKSSLLDSPSSSERGTAAVDDRGRSRILLVDDDDAILRIATRVLRAEHEVTSITRPQEALERLLAGEQFDLIVCDVTMPELTGLQLFAALLEAAPETARRVTFMTGGALDEPSETLLRTTATPVIWKPFTAQQLRTSVRDILASLTIGASAV